MYAGKRFIFWTNDNLKDRNDSHFDGPLQVFMAIKRIDESATH